MNHIVEYNIKDAELWDNVVHSFQDYDVFYLSGYSKAFMQENSGNGTPLLLYYEDGCDRAINVILKRDISFDERFAGRIEPKRYFDLTTPYGYGGFWGNVSDWDKLNREYRDYCIEKGYICEFVRFELFSEYYKHFDGEVETRIHNIVRGLEMPLDEIWMDFKQKVRKNVKKANSYNLKILTESTDEHLKDFLRIYYSTMDRAEAKQDYYFSEEFYENLCAMWENIMFFHVLYENKIISTELVIYGGDTCYSYLGGTDREYFNLRPNDFLKFEIIKWAKDKGLKNFVLGGGYGSDDGIFQYKQALAPKGVYDFYIGRRIFDKKNYDMLVELRDGDTLNDKYFPRYRS